MTYFKQGNSPRKMKHQHKTLNFLKWSGKKNKKGKRKTIQELRKQKNCRKGEPSRPATNKRSF